MGGVLFGGDVLVSEDLRAGVLGGYRHSTFKVGDRTSSGSADTGTIGAYAGWQRSALTLRGGAAFSWHEVSVNRSVAFTEFSDSLSASYSARTLQVFGEVGYGVEVGRLRFEPFANLAYAHLSTDGFTEQGGAAALTSSSNRDNTAFATLGLRAETDVMLGASAAKLRGMIGYRHAFGDVAPKSGFAFASGSEAFAVAGVPIARNALVLDAGFNVNLTSNTVLALAYGAQFGSRLADQSFKLSMVVRF